MSGKDNMGLIKGPGGGPPVGPIQMNIKPEDIKQLICPECQNPYFTEVFTMGKISALQNPSGEDLFVKQPIIICSSCGAVFDDKMNVIKEPDIKNKEEKTKEEDKQ